MIVAIAVSSIAVTAVNAQTVGTMPMLFNQNNVEVNGSNTYLAAGYYNLAGGQQVYYYGNGTFYNATAQTYGGSVNNPSGMAGVSIGSAGSAATAPGLPNTGVGGNAAMNWTILLASAAIAVAGIAYLGKSRESTKLKLA